MVILLLSTSPSEVEDLVVQACVDMATIELVRSAAKARERLERGGIDALVLLDVEATEPRDAMITALRAAAPRAPLLLLTRGATSEELAALVGAGIDDFVLWPRDAALLPVRLSLLRRRAGDVLRPATVPDLHTVAALLDALPDVHALLGADGTVLDCRGGGGVGGERQSVCASSNIGATLPAEAVEPMMSAVREVLETRRTARLEYVATQPSGKRFYEVLLVPSGAGHVFASRRDITDRKRAEQRVHETERFMQHIAATTPGIIYVYDIVERRLVYLNREVHKVLGYDEEELAAMGPRGAASLLYPEDLAQLDPQRYAARPDGDIFSTELRVRHKSGELRWLHTRSSIFQRNEDGTPTQIVGFAIDMTARRRDEGQLHQKTELLRSIVDNIPVMLMFFDPRARLEWVNREWEQTLGWTVEEIRTREAQQEIAPDPGELERGRAHMLSGDPEWQDFRARRRDGRILDLSWASVRLSDGSTVALGQDITARKSAEALRSRFIERVILAQEEERRRLALELHDETGQALTSLLVELRALEDKVDSDNGRADVRRLRELTAKTLDEVGRLARGLRPKALDDLGFPAAVEMHVAEFARTHAMHVDLYLNGFAARPRMPPKIETQLYRVLQEALTNVAKHAQATQVGVLLRLDETTVHAIVEDNGRGITTAGEVQPPASIRERAALMQGTVLIESTPGQGTAVFVEIPLGASDTRRA